jgi:ethanolamine utilization microcompartment shell protein EutL
MSFWLAISSVPTSEIMITSTPSYGAAACMAHGHAHAHGEVLGSMHAEHVKAAWHCLEAISQQSPASHYMHQTDASHFNANRTSIASHSLSALQVRGATMLYLLDSPLRAPRGLGGSLLVQHCIEGVQLAFTWSSGYVCIRSFIV